MPRRKSSFTTLEARFSDFEDRKQIGSGKDCVIYQTKWKRASIASKRTVVVKAYDKSSISSTKVRSIKREARMMNLVKLNRVPHVVDFYGSFQDSSKMYIVMEHCSRGDLLENILREGQALEERRAIKEVVIPLLISLTSLHQLCLIHRDIKLENIFVDESGGVKFGDFGLTMSSEEERGISPVGTVEYMAPELCKLPPADYIISGRIDPSELIPIDNKVDIWALGVTIYELVTGKTRRSPFEGESKARLKQSIIRYNIRRLPRYLSKECEDFLGKMLTYNAKDRPSAKALLEHPWVQANTSPITKQVANNSTSVHGEDASGANGASNNRRHRRSHEDQIRGGLSTDNGAKNRRRISENSPTPPLVSPTSILLVTERRKEKFQDKLAKLIPTYKAPKERELCMRGLWNLELSDSEENDEL
eukprot:g379.t1